MRSGLVFVLSAIILLNVVAIVLLQNRVTDVPEPVRIPEPEIKAPKPVPVAMPLIETLVLEDTTTCPDCYDIRTYIAELEGVLNMSVTEGDFSVFDLSRLPAIAFSSTVEEYPGSFIEGWEFYGKIVTIPSGKHAGKWYVLPTMNPPYLDEAGEIHGRVSVTYITMDSCEECYDVTLNRAFMEESRITPYKEEFIDVSSPAGKALVKQYGILAVPTIIMDAEASEYANMQPGWPLVGTIEEDGSYVLRDLQRLKVVYYDLEFDRLMEP